MRMILCCLIGLLLVTCCGYAIAGEPSKQDPGKAVGEYMTRYEDIAKTPAGPDRDKKLTESKSAFEAQRKALPEAVGSALTKFETAVVTCSDKKDTNVCGQVPKIRSEIENLIKSAAAKQKGGVEKETSDQIGTIIDMIR